jgi:tripartite ATP-independent transporter DctP family solute receptor
MMVKNGKFALILAITLGVLVGLNLVVFPAASPVRAAEITIRAATIVAPAFPYVPGLMKFKEVLEKNTGGKVEVKVYHSGQLGGERDIEEGMQQGTVQMGIGAGALANFAPIVNMLELPYLIKNQKHMHRIAKGHVGGKLAEVIEKQSGFKVLAYYSTGDSCIETVKVPVKTPGDLKGLKIRVMETPSLVDGLKALGANPTPMPYPEIYMGLRQGVIEGCHVDLLSVKTLKLYESLKYITRLDVAFLAEPRPLIISAAYHNKLPKDIQKAVLKAAEESAVFERNLFIEQQNTIVKELQQKGITFTSIDEGSFLVKIKPVWDKYAKELGPDAAWIIEEIKKLRP